MAGATASYSIPLLRTGYSAPPPCRVPSASLPRRICCHGPLLGSRTGRTFFTRSPGGGPTGEVVDADDIEAPCIAAFPDFWCGCTLHLDYGGGPGDGGGLWRVRAYSPLGRSQPCRSTSYDGLQFAIWFTSLFFPLPLFLLLSSSSFLSPSSILLEVVYPLGGRAAILFYWSVSPYPLPMFP